MTKKTLNQNVKYAQNFLDCLELDFNFNKTAILGMMIEDGFGDLNWEDLKALLNKIASTGVDVAV